MLRNTIDMYGCQLIIGEASDVQRVYRTMLKHEVRFSHCTRAHFTTGKMYGLAYDDEDGEWYVVSADTIVRLMM